MKTDMSIQHSNSAAGLSGSDQDSSGIPEVADSGWVCPSPEQLGVYFEEKSDGGGVFWVLGPGGYSPMNERNFKRWLVDRGFAVRGKPGYWQFESVVTAVISKARVHAAMVVAGYHPGVINANGRHVLITRGPKLIQADEKCHFEELRQIIHGVLGSDATQIMYFEQWLRIAYFAVRDGVPSVGQALVIAGPRECGKTLLQIIITKILGGREANPWQWMSGKTPFNHDFVAAEHLQFGDEIGDMSPGARRALAAKIKGLVANPSQRLEAKGKDAFVVSPLWRITMTLNDDPEYLAAVPPLDESVKDKVMLLKATPAPFLVGPVWMAMNRIERLDLINRQLPGYIAYLSLLPPVVAELRNARTGIVSYHNVELANLISSISSEHALLDAIDRRLFEESSRFTKDGYWEGTGSALEAALYASANSCSGEKRILDRIFSFHGAGGTLLNRLSKSKELNRVTRKSVRGSHIYRVSTDRKYVPLLLAAVARSYEQGAESGKK